MALGKPADPSASGADLGLGRKSQSVGVGRGPLAWDPCSAPFILPILGGLGEHALGPLAPRPSPLAPRPC